MNCEALEYEYYTINQAARLAGVSETFIRASGRLGRINIVQVEKEKLHMRMSVRPMVKAVAREELQRFVQEPSFKKSKHAIDLRKSLSLGASSGDYARGFRLY